MIVYTRNKKLKLCDAGGTALIPEVALRPMTRVDVLSTSGVPLIVTVGVTRWTKVRVLDQPSYGAEGYLPIAGLSEYAEREVLRVTGGTTAITRSEYGADSRLFGGPSLVQFEDPETGNLTGVLWEAYCDQCGQDARSHRIVETTMVSGQWTKPSGPGDKNAPRSAGTLDDARRLYWALQTHFASNQSDLTQLNGKFMLGVLHVEDDTVYATHSGKQNLNFYQTLCKKLGFIYCQKPVFGNNTFKTRGGDDVTSITPDKLSTCAAPKLICRAIKDGKYPYAMSEIWFDPADSHGEFPKAHTIESCAKCAGTIPYLLCP